MGTTGSAVGAAGWQPLGTAKPKRALCHLVVSIAFSMATLYGSGLARRGERRGVSGVREKCSLLSKVYPVLLKVFRWLYKVILLPIGLAISESGIFCKLHEATTLCLLRSSRAWKRSFA